MRPKKYHTDVEALLSRGGELMIEDIKAASPDMPMASVYAQIRSLISQGRIFSVGKGRYITTPKPAHRVEITPWMHEISAFLTQTLVGVNHCIRQQGGNLIVETDKIDVMRVLDALTKSYGKVALLKEARRFRGPLDGYILIGSLISEAPLDIREECCVPSLEKELVDNLCDGKDVGKNQLQQAMEVYPVNISRLRRYASRRNATRELNQCLSSLNQARIEMFNKVQSYLARTPIVRAWVFGSFARGEETETSDLDLLVTYDATARVSLLGTIRYKLDLEKLIGREVDLVEEGYLKPFAIPSAEHDKYLIYER